MNQHVLRRTRIAVTAGAAALLLAACGSDGDAAGGHGGHPSTPSSAPSSPSDPAAQGGHNAADVSFAQGMIPHHRQAVDMADLAATRAGSAEVKQLAEEIKKAQDPEIRTLSGWLTGWGQQVPAAGAADHSAHGAGGMMTAEEMDALGKASGRAFDTAFTRLMIKHHEGAVAMARTERTEGASPEARRMAEAVIASQGAEIARMKALLGTG
ncbi:lipoprotein [Streptomyces subrutilus]|uniref:DUF305 domain-containing protein n=1 Tax=Streptomyces subrutilus TaxID=36818 RepID=A0A5P2UTU7_9ACTN|nr:DUF305 domain-containing protein [Streptomyces subrutilus]QEU82543.1 DUF305 domain-containing protein [Streptomyces subrutilus]GGZ81963.1 lipoprotein [Streptomyces subrutilus]